MNQHTDAARTLVALTEANLSDLYRAFAVPQAFYPVAAPLLRPFARRFAEALLACDQRVAEEGLQQAMQETLRAFGVTLVTTGLEALPKTGPLIVTANHPGLTDAPALFAVLPRPDLVVLGAKRSLFDSLPAVRSRMIVAERGSPLRTVNRVARHLRSGGALLTFPAGSIEPDPAIDPVGAERSLGTWSESTELFCRLEPRTRVVPAIVAGVVTPATLKHPLTALHRNPTEKAWLAACLQVMFRHFQRNRVLVRFAPPVQTPFVLGPPRMADLLRASRALLSASR